MKKPTWTDYEIGVHETLWTLATACPVEALQTLKGLAEQVAKTERVGTLLLAEIESRQRGMYEQDRQRLEAMIQTATA